MYNGVIWGMVAVLVFFVYIQSMTFVDQDNVCISGICMTDVGTVIVQCTENACLFNLDGSKVISVLDHAYSWTVGGNCISVKETSSGTECINTYYFDKSKWTKSDYTVEENHVVVFSKR